MTQYVMSVACCTVEDMMMTMMMTDASFISEQFVVYLSCSILTAVFFQVNLGWSGS